jgi:hypothetical protein
VWLTKKEVQRAQAQLCKVRQLTNNSNICLQIDQDKCRLREIRISGCDKCDCDRQIGRAMSLGHQ